VLSFFLILSFCSLILMAMTLWKSDFSAKPLERSFLTSKFIVLIGTIACYSCTSVPFSISGCWSVAVPSSLVFNYPS
jgi:hypothetical protein